MSVSFRLPIRAADTELLDSFFVSAVTTLLLIRVFLAATDYPRVGGGGLHIAHVLWGGLGMLVAIVLFLSFLSPTTRQLGAIVGGAGFGAFIDELGKFLTADNDYFFKPTAALVYVLFIALYFVVREIRHRGLTPAEDLANAFRIAEQLAMGTISAEQRDRALALLAGADPAEPLVGALTRRFRDASVVARRGRAARIATAVSARYAVIARSRWFRWVIIAFFALQGLSFWLGTLALVVALVLAGFGDTEGIVGVGLVGEDASITTWTQLAADVIGGWMLLRGMVALRHSRAAAYHFFELAVLIDLLLVLPFQILAVGFEGSINVFLDLALIAALRYLTGLERGIARV